MFECIHDPRRGELYLVMEYIEGITIEDYVKKHIEEHPLTVLEERFVKSVIKQLILAVQYLHFNGVCHRDLKPDNLIVNPNT
jgi:serine/threonine protein kinase